MLNLFFDPTNHTQSHDGHCSYNQPVIGNECLGQWLSLIFPVFKQRFNGFYMQLVQLGGIRGGQKNVGHLQSNVTYMIR